MPRRDRTRLHSRALLRMALLATTSSACMNENLIKQPELNVTPGLPAGWTGTQNTSGIGTTITDRHGGGNAAYLSSAFEAASLNSYTLAQYIRADHYRGTRVQLSAWVKPRNVTNLMTSGIWMRVDGPGTTLAFDNMSARPVGGYSEWRQVYVVLDVPANAVGIALGATFQASNTLLVDDFKLEVVSTSTSTTAAGSGGVASGLDSAGTVAAYADKPLEPVNLGFEGLTASAMPVGPALTRVGAWHDRAPCARGASCVSIPMRANRRRRLYARLDHPSSDPVPLPV